MRRPRPGRTSNGSPPYDVSKAPTPVGGVLTPHFLLVFLGFAVLISAGFFADRFIATRQLKLAWFKPREDLEEGLLRAGMGGFFMALFATGGVILTPELHTDADWPAWLQLGIAVSMLSARTCIFGALGIVTLFFYAMTIYGVFHLSDYPMFLGIAAFLGLTSCTSQRLRSLRMPILHVTLCIGLMWGAIEKWAYPQWTLPLLAQHSYLTLGVPPADFMIIAGFVEFAVAFYILTGLSLVRLAIFALFMIFTSAILDFGKVDAIGHLPIIVPLVMMFLHGPTRLNRWLHDTSSSGLFAETRKASVAFTMTICLFFAAYYGIQYSEYHVGERPNVLAAYAASPPPH